MKPTVTWIVVADADHAKLFEHDGPGKGLRAIKDISVGPEHSSAGDVPAEHPGPAVRDHSEFREPLAETERRLPQRLAKVLEEKHRAGAFQRLVIAAAPAALGELRPALTAAVKETILAELPKDLTNIPMAKLGEHFDGLVAV